MARSFRKCAEDLRGYGSASDEVESVSNAVVRTLEGVEELQRMWEGFRRSGKCHRWRGKCHIWGRKCFGINDNCLRKGNE